MRGHEHKYHDPYINTAGRAGRRRPCGMMYRLFFGAGSAPGVPHKSRCTTLSGPIHNNYDVVERNLEFVRPWRPSGALQAGLSGPGCLPDACVGTRLYIRPSRVPDVTHIDAKGLWAGSNAAPGTADVVNVELALKLLRQHAGAVQPALIPSDPLAIILIAWNRAWARQLTGLGTDAVWSPQPNGSSAAHRARVWAPFFDGCSISTI